VLTAVSRMQDGPLLPFTHTHAHQVLYVCRAPGRHCWQPAVGLRMLRAQAP
jgi:hypothetical protein